MTVFPGAANFLLLKAPRSARKLSGELLSKDAIALRVCDNYEGLYGGRFLRTAVRTPEENARLVAALEQKLDMQRVRKVLDL